MSSWNSTYNFTKRSFEYANCGDVEELKSQTESVAWRKFTLVFVEQNNTIDYRDKKVNLQKTFLYYINPKWTRNVPDPSKNLVLQL